MRARLSVQVALGVMLVGSGILAGVTSGCGSGASPKAAAPAASEARVCTVCGATAPFETFNNRPDALCSTCASKERHRLLVHYLQNETPLLRDKLDVLQFSPEKGEADFLRKQANLKYRTSEYEAGKGDLRLDITAIAQPDASWDVLLVYHILEHIIDDRKAMSELYRILRPGGTVYLQVPIETGRAEIYEDAAIVGKKERAAAFGQWDHVRRYSAAGLKSRLEEAGFVVEVVDYLAKLDPAVITKHSLSGKFRPPLDEHIWVAKKPVR